MSWIRIWVHVVFSTKNREHWIKKEISKKLFQHIRENALKKEIWLDSIGGSSEHIHCLISLGGEQTVSKITQLVKGESSFWLNNNFFGKSKFHWQDDFWAVSVSESHLIAVRKYIQSQEEHHKNRTFNEEIDEFMQKYGWNIIHGK